jgi:hypothetical protein
MATTLDFSKVLGDAQRSAVHLEMRDSYLQDGLADPSFLAWRDRGITLPDDQDSTNWRELVASIVKRGVLMRRARIVSEPVTEYIRFEHAITAEHNIAVGEQVRWLPRRRASDIALPGNDFWCIDGNTVVFNHFTGDGSWSGETDMELSTEPGAVRLCAAAFEEVWARAVPHEDYRLV